MVKLAMTGIILDLNSGLQASCEVVGDDSTVLALITPRRFDLRACVKVEAGNKMWMGDVVACEAVDGGYAVEVESSIMAKDMATLTQTASRFRQSRPHDSKTRETSRKN